jgi:hypothetical protein
MCSILSTPRYIGSWSNLYTIYGNVRQSCMTWSFTLFKLLIVRRSKSAKDYQDCDAQLNKLHMDEGQSPRWDWTPLWRCRLRPISRKNCLSMSSTYLVLDISLSFISVHSNTPLYHRLSLWVDLEITAVPNRQCAISYFASRTFHKASITYICILLDIKIDRKWHCRSLHIEVEISKVLYGKVPFHKLSLFLAFFYYLPN